MEPTEPFWKRRVLSVRPHRFKVLLLHNVDPLWNDEDLKDVLHQVAQVVDGLVSVGVEVRELRVQDPLVAMKLCFLDPHGLLVLNWCESIPGMDRSEPLVPQILEDLGFHYTGSPPRVLALSWDKIAVKELLERAGVPIPPWRPFYFPEAGNWSSFPAIVKPAMEHCSAGITSRSVVLNEKELLEEIERVIVEMKQPALVEEFIDGPEYHVTLWGNSRLEMLPPAEMDFSSFEDVRERLCTFDSKFTPGSKHYEEIQVKVPARLSESQLKSLEEVAVRAYLAAGCRDYARLDLRARDGIPYVLDVNPNPDIGPDTSMALCAQDAGYSYGEMLKKLVQIASARCPVWLTQTGRKGSDGRGSLQLNFREER